MPFCTSCGANVDAGTKFCTKCGASMTGASGAPAAAASPAAPAKGGSSALKIVLIILGVCLLLGALGVGAAVYTAYRVAKAAKEQAQQTMGGIKVETPEGTVTVGGEDAGKPAGPVEVEVYPGAVPEKSTSTVSMGGVSVASAVFTTSDPPAKVADFYRKQYPKTMLFSQQGEHTSMMVNTDKGMLTIVIEPFEGKTKITVAHMGGGKKPEGQEPN